MLQLFLLFFGAVAAVAAPPVEPVLPRPYEATYEVSYRGIGAGLLHFELSADKKGGRYIFASHAEPNLIARIVVSNDAVERSVMRIDADGVTPLSWHKEDGKAGEKEDGMVDFDWTSGKVSGVVQGKPVELDVVPGLQDPLSMQIAAMFSLLNGYEPGTVPMLQKHKIRRYIYTRQGTGSLETQAGTFEGVLYEITRPGSDRTSRIWHAPAIGFIPIRAEQLRDGKIETVIELVQLRRAPVLENPPD